MKKTRLFIAVAFAALSNVSFAQNVWDGTTVPTNTTGSGVVTIGQTNSTSYSTTPTVKLKLIENNPFIELTDLTYDPLAAPKPTGSGIRFSNYNLTYELKSYTNGLLGQGLFMSNSANDIGISLFQSRIFLGTLSLTGSPLGIKFGDVNLVANSAAYRMTVYGSNYSYPVLDANYNFAVYGKSLFTSSVVIGGQLTDFPNGIPAGYSLYVKTGILAEKLKVATVNSSSWADFVFEKNYKLRSLSEVEAYIKENKHLPEIPTTQEVSENGFDVAEMDAKLLQKIEELTLYMIEMKKENEVLKGEVETLKNKLK